MVYVVTYRGRGEEYNVALNPLGEVKVDEKEVGTEEVCPRQRFKLGRNGGGGRDMETEQKGTFKKKEIASRKAKK